MVPTYRPSVVLLPLQCVCFYVGFLPLAVRWVRVVVEKNVWQALCRYSCMHFVQNWINWFNLLILFHEVSVCVSIVFSVKFRANFPVVRTFSAWFSSEHTLCSVPCTVCSASFRYDKNPHYTILCVIQRMRGRHACGELVSAGALL